MYATPRRRTAGRNYGKPEVADQPPEAGQSRREALAAAAGQVEAALRRCGRFRDPESEQRAARQVERATRHLQEQFGPADTPPAKR